MIGETISHYEILEELGRGGMGVVYKARDLNLDRLVALKFLSPHTLEDQDSELRFVNEAKAASALDHKNVCTVYEIDTTESGQRFIAMAFYDGEALSDRIERGPLGLGDALSIAIQVGEGLSAAHERGIVHRDIKPGNVFLPESGEAKIVDFGLAKLTGASQLTKSGIAVGTAVSMSPEQAQGAGVDSRTDVWALGVLLYEMIAGKPPFGGDHEQAVIYSILHEDPIPLTGLRTGVPLELDRIAAKAMAKDARERYQSIEDMLVDLRAEYRSLASEEKSSLRTSTRAPGASRARPRLRMIVSATGLVLIVAVTFLYISIRRNEERGSPPAEDLAGGASRERGTTEAVSRADRIAVIPFDNISPNPENEYFAAGMTEEIISRLSRVHGLRVIARTSVMQYEGTTKSVSTIGNELDVGTILEGSVRVSGDQLRITAQLIDTANQEHLWSEDYDRQMEDVFDIQSEVAEQVTLALRDRLVGARLAKGGTPEPKSLESYQAYLKGRFLWAKRDLVSFEEAIEYFQEAIRLDSSFAPAYAGMADAYILIGSYGGRPMRKTHPEARRWAEKALEIDPNLAEAHASLGTLIADYYWEWGEAERHFETAIELNPNYATAHQWYGELLRDLLRFDEAIAHCRIAVSLDPMGLAPNAGLALSLIRAGRYREGIAKAREVLDLYPDYPLTRMVLAATYYNVGDLDAAFDETEVLMQTTEDIPDVLGVAGYLYYKTGHEEKAREVFARLDLLARSRHIPAFAFVAPALAVGDTSGAVEQLEQAYRDRDWQMRFLASEELLKPLRSNPRVIEILEALKLPHP